MADRCEVPVKKVIRSKFDKSNRDRRVALPTKTKTKLKCIFCQRLAITLDTSRAGTSGRSGSTETDKGWRWSFLCLTSNSRDNTTGHILVHNSGLERTNQGVLDKLQNQKKWARYWFYFHQLCYLGFEQVNHLHVPLPSHCKISPLPQMGSTWGASIWKQSQTTSTTSFSQFSDCQGEHIRT